MKQSQMHVKALKIYTAILLQFMISTIICAVGINVKQMWAYYFFYINHIGNPVIYYCFVPKFREGVKASARALCSQEG